MSFLARRGGAVLLVLVGLLASLVLVGVSPATAATGQVRGVVYGPQKINLHVQMLWFTKDWKFLGKAKVPSTNIYSLTLPAGSYHLQFVDLRPSYDINKYAPSDIFVTVRAGSPTQHDVKMHRGAAITGTAKGGDHRILPGARLVAANTHQQSYETKANGRGQWAIGGLPDGNYSVFTFDRDRIWVGKSLWVPKIERGQIRNVSVTLKQHGGRLLVDLHQGDGRPMLGKFFVTAVSKASGQFWTEQAKGGEVSFDDLYPGKYKLVAPGHGRYLAQTGTIQGAYVKAGGSDLASTFTWTRLGAKVQGIVVDYEDPSYPLSGAEVMLFNADGDKLGSTTSNANGFFSFGGQLDTQDGLKVVAGPGPYSDYLGEEPHRCKFGHRTSDAFAVTRGQTSDIGAVELPHLPAAQQTNPSCDPSDGS
ncbi:hypothetical protein FB382_000295 [Nocardioides ginsengisegetis]|uniref:Carboxypeptidase regulatory-like domain-containing protein n=1 Tax=Nocardioides ginsengisegetis TaxID=661491 RepID=A0A7W3P831_9ACTN|nr:carboxypeptidase-like regulatory domain-containing protein [Nocardioides ginsengisegetis]MBA8802004.1 hypothetical protein [Nocardioides ginsengisegetis]